MVPFLLSLILFIVILGIVINIHELGHFIAAKLSGMVVEEFSFGMGPKLFGFKAWGTNFIVRPILVGGYVKILGEEEESESKDSYTNKPAWQKLMVILAGVFMNSLLAVVLMYIVLFSKGFEYPGIPYYEDFNAPFGTQEKDVAYPVTVVEVEENEGVYDANIEAPFEILKVDGKTVDTVDELRDSLLPFANESVNLQIMDESEKEYSVDVNVNADGKIGVYTAGDVYVWVLNYEGVNRYFAGFEHFCNMFKANYFILGRLIGQAFQEKDITPVAQNLSGPVGLFSIIDLVRQYGGIIGIIDLIAMLNLALVFMNILPLPVLDGGQALLIVAEWIKGSPLNERFVKVLTGIGIGVLVLLMVAISVKDVVQLF